MDQTQQMAKDAAARLDKRTSYLIAKRLFDLVFSAAVLVALGWLLVLVAIAIRLDDPSGPPLFCQDRVGKNGKVFRMYKFRSMCVNAESQLAQLQKLNERDGPAFKIKDDPRVTRVGRFIRRTNIDELPQFVNVLRGDMSVVGPRPALPQEVEHYSNYQRLRLLVKPGITCYWQTDPNRDELTFDDWVARDIRYMETCGALCDLRLIVRTVWAVLHGQGS